MIYYNNKQYKNLVKNIKYTKINLKHWYVVLLIERNAKGNQHT